MANPEPRIIGAGLVTIDIAQTCDVHFTPAEGPPCYMSGGTVSNILAYLSALSSWPCTLFGGVGDDQLGPVLMDDLKGFGVNTEVMVTRKGVPTRRIVHFIAGADGAGGSHRFRMECYKCDRPFPAFDPPTLAEFAPTIAQHRLSATVLIVDRANELTVDLAKRVAAAKGVVIFEPGYVSRNRPHVNELVSYADILKYSADLRWGNAFFGNVIPKNRPRLKLIVETRSSKGIRLFSVPRQTEIRLTTTPLLRVRDAAGAGDAFMAGFLTGLGIGNLFRLDTVSLEDFERAAQRGQALGAIACCFYGSKGTLYATSVADIEGAIDTVLRSLQLPDGFGRDELPNRPAPPAESDMCPVCRLPLETTT
jgi:fructokinase